MIQHWALTTPTGPTPDEPHVVLRTTDGINPEVWSPGQNAWVPAPIYFDAIYGDDPDAVTITDQQAEQYKADGVGMDEEALAKVLALTDTPPPAAQQSEQDTNA